MIISPTIHVGKHSPSSHDPLFKSNIVFNNLFKVPSTSLHDPLFTVFRQNTTDIIYITFKNIYPDITSPGGRFSRIHKPYPYSLYHGEDSSILGT